MLLLLTTTFLGLMHSCFHSHNSTRRTMQESSNPFLHVYEVPDLNQTIFDLNLPRTAEQISSTPLSRAPVTSQQPIYLLNQPTGFSYKQMKLTFNGLSHEDAQNFITEFESHLILMNVDLNSQKTIAAFRLQLRGPALTWFNTLNSNDVTWFTLKAAFLAEYGYNASALIAEEAAFQNLALHSGHTIEEFHAVIQEKGTRLNKSEREMVTRFTNGLPNQLAFFVRASRATNFRECLHIAKTGEAHGYRSVDTSVTAAAKPVQSQVPNQPQNAHPQRKVRCCYKCQGSGHIKPNCLWTGQGGKHPDVICQLCDQKGHSAKNCVLNPRSVQITHGGRASGRAASTSLSGAYLQNYSSYGYEISWVDRSHQRGVQCAGS